MTWTFGTKPFPETNDCSNAAGKLFEDLLAWNFNLWFNARLVLSKPSASSEHFRQTWVRLLTFGWMDYEKHNFNWRIWSVVGVDYINCIGFWPPDPLKYICAPSNHILAKSELFNWEDSTLFLIPTMHWVSGLAQQHIRNAIENPGGGFCHYHHHHQFAPPPVQAFARSVLKVVATKQRWFCSQLWSLFSSHPPLSLPISSLLTGQPEVQGRANQGWGVRLLWEIKTGNQDQSVLRATPSVKKEIHQVSTILEK